MVFDKDNTVTLPFCDHLHSSVEATITTIKETFCAENVAVLSNSAGSCDDEAQGTLLYPAATAAEKSMNLQIIRHGCKKPSTACFLQVVAHFASASAACGSGSGSGSGSGDSSSSTDTATDVREVRASEICLVGDRLLTDVVFANTHGLQSVYVHTPLTEYISHTAPAAAAAGSGSASSSASRNDNDNSSSSSSSSSAGGSVGEVHHDHPVASVARYVEKTVLLPMARRLSGGSER